MNTLLIIVISVACNILLSTALGLVVVRYLQLKKSIQSLRKDLLLIGSDGTRNSLPLANDINIEDLVFCVSEALEKKTKIINGLETALKTQENLLTNISHDLRTPLASLLGYLEAIQQGVISQNEISKYMEIVLRKAYEFKHYVDCLFELLKNNTSSNTLYVVDEVEIIEYTRRLLINWIPQFEKQHIALTFDTDHKALYVSISELQYRRIVDNVIGNCCEHSNCTAINLNISSDDKTWKILISDNGSGIEPSYLTKINNSMTKNQQVPSKKNSGFGLSIVYKLTKRLGGTMNITSVIGTGTFVEISFEK